MASTEIILVDQWHTHRWLDEHIVLIGGVHKREHFCDVCKRRLVEYDDSGKYVAAYASIFDYEPLAAEVTVRWLNEPCPGRELPEDIEAYKNRPRRNWRAYLEHRLPELVS